MKMTIAPNTRQVKIETETPDDQYLLGKLVVRLKGKAHVSNYPEKQKTLEVDAKDLLTLLAD